MDGGKPVNAAAKVFFPRAGAKTVNGPKQFVDELLRGPDLPACAARQLFRYGMGRKETDADNGALTKLAESSGQMHQFLLSLATSHSFLFRRPNPGEVQP